MKRQILSNWFPRKVFWMIISCARKAVEVCLWPPLVYIIMAWRRFDWLCIALLFTWIIRDHWLSCGHWYLRASWASYSRKTCCIAMFGLSWGPRESADGKTFLRLWHRFAWKEPAERMLLQKGFRSPGLDCQCLVRLLWNNVMRGQTIYRESTIWNLSFEVVLILQWKLKFTKLPFLDTFHFQQQFSDWSHPLSRKSTFPFSQTTQAISAWEWFRI